MKKIFAVLAASAMAFSMYAFAGCGKSKDNGDGDELGNKPSVPDGVQLTEIKGEDNIINTMKKILDTVDAVYSNAAEDEAVSLYFEGYGKNIQSYDGDEITDEYYLHQKSYGIGNKLICEDESTEAVISGGGYTMWHNSWSYFREGKCIDGFYDAEESPSSSNKEGGINITESNDPFDVQFITYDFDDIIEYYEDGEFPYDEEDGVKTTVTDITLKVNSTTSPTKVYFAYTLDIKPLDGDSDESEVQENISYFDIQPGYTKSSFPNPVIDKNLSDNLLWFDIDKEQFAQKFLAGEAISITASGNGPKLTSNHYKIYATIYGVDIECTLSDGVLDVPADAYQTALSEALRQAEEDGIELDISSGTIYLRLNYVNTDAEDWDFDYPIYGESNYLYDSESSYRISFNI